jgi:hypothetical protein
MGVGIEQDQTYYLPMHLFWEGLGQLGVRGKEVWLWLGWVGFQLMIERIDQLWLILVSCSKSSFFFCAFWSFWIHACIGFMCLFYNTFSFYWIYVVVLPWVN